MFYHVLEKGKFVGTIKGFPQTIGSWCKKLKSENVDLRGYILQEFQNDRSPLWFPDTAMPMVSGLSQNAKRGTRNSESAFFDSPKNEGRKINIIQYLGIAADEPLRIKKHISRPNIVLPLVEIGWEEDLCGLISGYQNLLSPVYTSATRDGCWFCHNQGVGQLRNLRKNFPELWSLLLKWDTDSPVTFKPDGRTVHDFDARFALEDEGLISPEDPWSWGYIQDRPLQLRMKF